MTAQFYPKQTDYIDKLNALYASVTAAVTASGITNVPAGNIVATNVQSAINELDTEKAAIAGTLAQFASTTSAQLRGVLSDETGTGVIVCNDTPTLIAPLLGTPTSGVLTNCTGTASGLTAGNVTTNANLTGPITSVGNATSVAAQTGTGTTFVMQNTPTLTTPVLGTATATKITATSGASADTNPSFVAVGSGSTQGSISFGSADVNYRIAGGAAYGGVDIVAAGTTMVSVSNTAAEVKGKLVLQTATSPLATGQFGYDATAGNYIWAKGGSGADFTIYDNAGTATFELDTGIVRIAGAINVGTDGVTPGAYTNVITLAAPASSGSTRGDFSRILDYVGSRVLDTGLSSSTAWIQSRDQNSYATNYALALNPNGGSVDVGSGGFTVSGSVDINKASGLPNISLRSANTYRAYIEGISGGGLLVQTGSGLVGTEYNFSTSTGLAIGPVGSVPLSRLHLFGNDSTPLSIKMTNSTGGQTRNIGVNNSNEFIVETAGLSTDLVLTTAAHQTLTGVSAGVTINYGTSGGFGAFDVKRSGVQYGYIGLDASNNFRMTNGGGTAGISLDQATGAATFSSTITTGGPILLGSSTIGSSSAAWIGGNSSSTDWFINVPTSKTITLGINNSSVAQVSSAGVFVDGGITVGVATPGATAAKTLCLSNNAIAPTTSVDRAHLYCADVSAGNAALALYQEMAPYAGVAVASTTKIPMIVNGVTYYILATTVA